MFQSRSTRTSRRDTAVAVARVGVTVAVLWAAMAAIRSAARRRAQLTMEESRGAVVRARRRAGTAQAGTVAGNSRSTNSVNDRGRVPGIRREELALLAGVSVSYYTRIEQGAVPASPGVLDALANALRLDEEDRAQLHRLANLHPAKKHHIGPAALAEQLELVLRTIEVAPAGVLGRSMELLGWNRLAHAVFADHLPFDAPWAEPGRLNWARQLFVDDT